MHGRDVWLGLCRNALLPGQSLHRENKQLPHREHAISLLSLRTKRRIKSRRHAVNVPGPQSLAAACTCLDLPTYQGDEHRTSRVHN
jgi:hypothetical protein